MRFVPPVRLGSLSVAARARRSNDLAADKLVLRRGDLQSGPILVYRSLQAGADARARPLDTIGFR